MLLVLALNCQGSQAAATAQRQWQWQPEQQQQVQQQIQKELLARELMAEALRERQIQQHQQQLQLHQSSPYFLVNVPMELPPVVVADELNNLGGDAGNNMLEDGGAQKAKRAQPFVRLGKRAQTFVRFGKRAQMFVRFGRDAHMTEQKDASSSGGNRGNANQQ